MTGFFMILILVAEISKQTIITSLFDLYTELIM